MHTDNIFLSVKQMTEVNDVFEQLCFERLNFHTVVRFTQHLNTAICTQKYFAR